MSYRDPDTGKFITRDEWLSIQFDERADFDDWDDFDDFDSLEEGEYEG